MNLLEGPVQGSNERKKTLFGLASALRGCEHMMCVRVWGKRERERKREREQGHAHKLKMFLHRDKFLKNDLLMFEKNFDEKIKIRRSLEKILGLVFLIDFLHLIESEVWNPRVELCLIIINSNSRKNLFDQTDNSHSLLRFFSISEFLVKSPNYDSPNIT